MTNLITNDKFKSIIEGIPAVDMEDFAKKADLKALIDSLKSTIAEIPQLDIQGLRRRKI